MKKQIFIIAGLIMAFGLFISGSIQAQQWTDGTSGNIYKTVTPGNVGIGITAPTSNLHVKNSSAPCTSVLDGPYTGTGIMRVIGNFDIINSSTGDLFRFVLRKNASGNHEVIQTGYSSALGGWIAFSYLNLATGKYEIRSSVTNTEFLNTGNVLLNNTGSVGIGTGAVAIPVGVKLAVNGKVNCKEVEVTLSGWSDYVFGKDYKLKSLYEVENFISENKHLPDVPSETEVLQKGTNLGEMDAILLKKIEELTLYVIDLKKENDLLKAKIQKLGH